MLQMRVTIAQEWKNQLFVDIQKVLSTLSTVMTHFFNICIGNLTLRVPALKKVCFLKLNNLHVMNEVPITQEQKNHPFVDIQKVSFNTLYCHNTHSHWISIALVLKVVPQYYK